MIEMDSKLDSNPTTQLIIEFVRTAIRNKQCFRELEYLNRKGTLLMKHPLLQNFSLRQCLKNLLRTNPDKFLADYTLAKNNISRYQSYLNNPQKGAAQQREGWQSCLCEHTEKVNLMSNILKEMQ
ncbi:MAG: hypothetical protein LBK94_04945 [Prevotellaceae bacterium]|jgi:hypothetical protein|nr:hypothetical protein [Prevotellaceae bacterium]